MQMKTSSPPPQAWRVGDIKEIPTEMTVLAFCPDRLTKKS